MLLYELNNLVTGNVVYNDTLNPKIYDDDDDMRPEVHAALMSVVDNFIIALDLPGMIVHDVILTGSSANYNWTKFSDIDLHLISDVDVFSDPHMAAKYFNAAKNVWNNKHDVDIRGIDVEVYVEDNDEHNESLGRFSVMNDDWITKPDHNTPVFDEAALNRKVRYIMKEIDMLMQDDDLVTDIEHLKEKIWLMRGEGLAKAGEYSVENLAFKVLRNMGYLDKILKALRGAEDREMSVNEMKLNEINKRIQSTKIRTDTGSARLYSDGSMIVYNSGFRQKLTPEMVQAAWGRKKVLPHHPKMLVRMAKEGLSRIDIKKSQPRYDGMYWDFGDEQHEIPKKQEFVFAQQRSRSDRWLTEDEITGSVEEVGAMYAKYKTDDYQNRDGEYPKGGVPAAIHNAGSYGDEAFIEFTFKNTSEGQAKSWVNRFLQSKKLPMTSMNAGQDGDYADDWVIVAVTYKLVTEDDTSLTEKNLTPFTPKQISDMKLMIRQWNSGSTGGRYRDEVEGELIRRGYGWSDVQKMAKYIAGISHHGK